jgi:cell division protein ZapA (FtsZ GTPase activity inhibitor)
MSERNAVTVRIAGEEHAIRSSAPPEYTRRCARLVDERITEIRRRSGLVEGHRAAILAALSITDEFYQAREELDRLREEVAGRAARLTERIDEAVGPED